MTHSFPTRRSSDLNRKRSPPYPCLHPYAGSSHQAYALVADVRPSPPPCSGMGDGRRHWICADYRSCDPEAIGLRLFKPGTAFRSEEHTSELQSLMRSSYAVFCLQKKTTPSATRCRTTATDTQFKSRLPLA